MNYLVTLSTLLLSQFATAQEGALAVRATPVGWRTAVFTNSTGKGSPKLKAVVHYPAKPGQGTEQDAAIATREGGYPVIVFLHGLGGTGPLMQPMGSRLAQSGYIVVCTDTTRSERELQATNARAFFQSLVDESGNEESFFAGQFDMSRSGISGHSMGGGNSAKVLTENPGYKVGFCFAPWTTSGRESTGAGYLGEAIDKIDVPIGILHGINDRVLPWEANALSLHSALAGRETDTLFWRLDEDATHINVAFPASSRTSSSDPDRKVFELCTSLAVAFFDRFLREKAEALLPYLDNEKAPAGVVEVYKNTQEKKRFPAPQSRRAVANGQGPAR